MRRRLTTSSLLASSALALGLTLGVSPSWAEDESLEFSELRVLIEINATDGDAGLQTMIDADGWTQVTFDSPDGKKTYEVRGHGNVAKQGLTENFFESAEPSCEEVPMDAFLARFPAGEYRFTGTTIDGKTLEGDAELTHELPGAPKILAPHRIGGVDPAAVTIKWAPGGDLGGCPSEAGTITPPGEVALFGYQVIVWREAPEPALEFTAEVPRDVTSLTLPPEFLQADAVYKFEILAIEAREEGERGNQTITESYFCTAPIATGDCSPPD
jgi:hypothetical protein